MVFNSEAATVVNRKSSRQLTIGVLKSQMVDQRDTLMVEGLQHAADENGVNLIVYRGGMIVSPDDIDKQAISIFEFVDKNRLDGLIIWTGNINWHASQGFTEMFVKRYNFLPIVSLEFKIDGVTSILWDNYSGMREALVHLIEVHNYKRIGFIMGTPLSLYQRYESYIETLKEYGIPIDPKIIIDHNELYNFQNALKYATYIDRSIFVEQGIVDNFEKSIKVVENLLGEGIEALACCNDLSARVVNRVVKARNLPIIPMVGFDDDPESRAGNPALTTVRPPLYEIGRRAVEVIIDKINGLNTPETEILPCSLMVRQSCGCTCSSILKEDSYKGRLKQCIIPQDSDTDNAEKFEKLVKSVIVVPEDMDTDWSGKLLKAFFDDIQGDSGVFADYLKNLFVYAPFKKHIDIFQDIILLLNFFIDSLINNNSLDHYKAKMLLKQGTVLAADMRVRLEMNKRFKQTHRHFDIVTFSQIISNTYDINEIIEKTSFGLKYMGILSCYISIYENGGASTDIARLMLAFNESGNIKISQEACIFPSKQLLPEEIPSFDKRFHFILKPLHFRGRNIGFVMYSDTLDDSTEYERINEAISNAIYSAIFVDELRSKKMELTKINSELESAYSLLKDNQQKLLISEKMASLGRLTAGIAHEMNTPLAAVRTTLKELGDFINEYNESIGNPGVLPEDHKSIAEDMKRCLKLAAQAAEKSTGFINAIKAQTTNINTTNLQLFNAADVMKDALAILEFALRKGNCNLITNFDSTITLYGDPNKLVQVATNLVINSIDACKPDGGNISVKIENNGDGFAKLTFQDTGCGIPEEIKTRIFDPMFTTKPFGEGTGLGLSIVHDLVNEYNGSINVESKKGLTSFFIYLPIEG